ncbi:MAG: hypothetical protein M3P98_02065 [bacterium]|nr:hypothetical protein [bacterium]
MTDKKYTNVILEEIRSQFYALTEIVVSIRDEMRTKAPKEDLEDLETS